ncbi:MAG: 3-deoxy-7-phosphoheptulonate synthase [Acidobacteriota bacterium]|nr:3-deoxy-7-phosphoheptulonate synthase [Acidobacteriota bacterium]
MLIVMKKGISREDLDRVFRTIEELGFEGHAVPGEERVAVGITGNSAPIDPTIFDSLPGVAQAIGVTRPYRLVSREARSEDTVVRAGSLEIGGGSFTIIAGPCAVESEEQVLALARLLRGYGANMLRGGAFKPRTSPYSFQGLGKRALELLARAREETGLRIVTEAVDESSLALVEEYADVIQIGARNMQNFSLLRLAGRSKLPVFLKRGMSATLEDLLMSAEHVLSEGNANVILCERGIRTFSQHSRFTLDLSIIPALRRVSHLPVFADPSHGTGQRDSVVPMARAALAAGADGVMVEVHPAPERALSDGPQALLPDQFEQLVHDLRAMAPLFSRRMEPVS